MTFAKKYLFLTAIAMTGATCFSLNQVVAQHLPSDKNATKETIHLYENLKGIDRGLCLVPG
jgi:hypothetical protein